MSLDRARRSRPAGLPSPRLLLLASIAAVSLAAPLPAQVKLYEKKATLQATMLAARARLTEWQQSQAAARQAVKIGGWQRAKLGPGEKLTAGFPSASPRWITCPSDRSGNVLLPREPGEVVAQSVERGPEAFPVSERAVEHDSQAPRVHRRDIGGEILYSRGAEELGDFGIVA